jgi:F-type H+-transporting ATPase subunit b
MFTRAISGLLLIAAVLACAATAGAAQRHAPPEGAAHAEAEGSDALNPLSPQYLKADLAIWTAAVFLLLLLVLWKFAWGPLSKGLDKRQQEIVNQIAEAEEANRQAKQLLGQYEQKLADARNDVRGILDQARRDAEQLGREMLEKAKAEAEAERQQALRQIDAATSAALQELADRGAALAVELAGRILHAQLSASDHAQLIEQTVAEFVGKN